MADYIDRQATIDAIHSALYPYFCGMEDGDILSEDEKLVLSVNKTICKAIKALPSADVQSVRHGHWMLCEDQNQDDVNNGNYLYVCSNCNHSDIHARTVDVPFCWFCGAKMDEVE